MEKNNQIPSRKDMLRRGLLPGALIGIAGAIGYASGWVRSLYQAHPPTDAGSAASWVQAFGSIGAIISGFAGIILADHFQRRAAQKKDDDSYQSLRLSCLSMAQLAMDEVDRKVLRLQWTVLSTTQANQAVTQDPGLREAARMVETLPVYRFGPHAMSAARGMALRIRHLDQAIRDHSSVLHVGGPDYRFENPATVAGELERTEKLMLEFADNVHAQHRMLTSALGGEWAPTRAAQMASHSDDGTSISKLNDTSETVV